MPPSAQFTETKAMLADFNLATNAAAERLATVGTQFTTNTSRLAEYITRLLTGTPMSAAERAEITADVETIKANIANASMSLDDEAAALTATGVEASDPTPTVEVNTVNQAGADNGIGAVGDIIASDNPNLAQYKSSGWVDTTTE